MENSQVWKGMNLNPGPVTAKVYGYNNMVDANNACYRSCYRNLALNPTDLMNTGCGMNCQRVGIDLIKLNNRNPDVLKLVPPPFWIEPNYFRQGMAKYQDVNQAYNYCNQSCDMYRYPQECKKNCFIDANSIFINPTNQKM